MTTPDFDNDELETPDELATVLPGDCSERTDDRLAELLADDHPAEPLLFRPWPDRWNTAALAVSAGIATILFLGLAYYYVDRLEYAFVVGLDPALIVFTALGLVGPVLGLLWPAWRRWLESRRGYRFGDYVFEFGYVVARPAEVTLRAWWDVSAETDENDRTVHTIHTAGDHDIPIGERFEGDHLRADERLHKYNRDELPFPAQKLLEHDDSRWVSSFDQLRYGFFGPLAAVAALAATGVATVGATHVQEPLQHRSADRLIDQFEQTLESLRNHEHEAVERFDQFAETCDDDVYRVLFYEHDGDVADGAPLRRVYDRICRQVEAQQPLTHFDFRGMYGLLAEDADPEHREVVRQRLELHHRAQLRELQRNIRNIREDRTDEAEFFVHLVESFVDQPRHTFEIRLQPVLPVELQDRGLLLDRILAEESLGIPGLDAPDHEYVEEHGREVVEERLDTFVPAPDVHVTGARDTDHHYYVSRPVERGLEGLVSQLVGHDFFSIEFSLDERKFSPRLLEDEQFDDVSIRDLDLEDPDIPDADRPDPEPVDDTEARPVATVEQLAEQTPAVDMPTLRVVYGARMADDWNQLSVLFDRSFPELAFPFVVQWIDPDDGVVWSLEETFEPGERFWRGVDSENPHDYYGHMYNSVFEQLGNRLEGLANF